jgi:hypothetical protein
MNRSPTYKAIKLNKLLQRFTAAGAEFCNTAGELTKALRCKVVDNNFVLQLSISEYLDLAGKWAGDVVELAAKHKAADAVEELPAPTFADPLIEAVNKFRVDLTAACISGHALGNMIGSPPDALAGDCPMHMSAMIDRARQIFAQADAKLVEMQRQIQP